MLSLKNYLAIAVLLASSPTLFSQKMLQGSDWCAQGHGAGYNATDSRSDSVDIILTTLHLDITNFAAQEITAFAAISLKPLVPGVQMLRFDLSGLTIDSLFFNSDPVNWSYDGEHIDIQLTAPMEMNSMIYGVQVYYHGHPVQDVSGWGGFYWSGNYAYNLGVGFAADPHSYGRALFPCFDNFVERCRFNFQVTSPIDLPAFCNGTLYSQNIINGNLVRIWTISDPIPSYLACVAVGPYVSFERQYQGENGPIPVQIAVAAGDTSKLKNSFVHLPDALACFEHWYGPYRWDKIGYSIVPFNSGAMEHATNIAYMRAAVDGTTNFETLMAHEFSHHWWGDLATCSTAEDMWLNEGWASYSEHLFTEWVYGKNAYKTAVEANFLDVLENAHVEEGGYRAISGVPHDLTYGTHVYHKGASVIHNLRSYLGDSLFRQGLNEAMDNYQFHDWSSADLRNQLSASTGVNLDHFFDDWVFQPGFTHFAVDSMTVVTGPIDTFFIAKVYVKQKLRGADHFYQDVPLEFVFINANWEKEIRTTLVSGQQDTLEFHFPLNFFPQKVWLNPDAKLTLAQTFKDRVVKAAGNYPFTPAKFTINFTAVPDSALVHVEYHWAMPDTAGSANPNGYILSNRYWTVDGFFPEGLAGRGSLFYDGKGMLDQLDAELFAQTSPSEDSILLLYRPGPGFPWQEHPLYLKNTVGSTVDRYGFMRIDLLLSGEYTIGKGLGTSAVRMQERDSIGLRLTPNPARQYVNLKSERTFDQCTLYSVDGNTIKTLDCAGCNAYRLDLTNLPSGTYWIVVQGPEGMGVAKLEKQ